MLRRVFLCAVVVGCVFASDLTRAAIINGDFETGDFSGWSVDLDADNGANDVPGTAQVATIDGSFRAVLTATTDVYVELSPQSQSLAEITQTITLTEPATIAVDISGSYETLAAPLFFPGGYTNLFVRARQTNMAASYYPLLLLGTQDTGHVAHSFGPMTVSVVVPAGEYWLTASVFATNTANGETGGFATATLTVDNLRILAAPEPSSLALIVMAAGALPLIGLRRRHSADSTQ